MYALTSGLHAIIQTQARALISGAVPGVSVTSVTPTGRSGNPRRRHDTRPDAEIVTDPPLVIQVTGSGSGRYHGGSGHYQHPL